MRDHEIDLITALVEGRLEDESEARALIASSPELQAEYEAQQLAREELTAAGPAMMSDAERAALRRDVWTALRFEPVATARNPWYYRWVPVGAGIFVIGIGLVAVLNQGSREDSQATEAVAEIALTTEAASDTEAEESDGESFAGGATDLTEAPTAATPTDDRFGEMARALRLEGGEAFLDMQSEDEAKTDHEACLSEAGLDGYVAISDAESPVFEAPATTDVPSSRVVAAIPPETDLATAPITFVDLDTCEVVYVDG